MTEATHKPALPPEPGKPPILRLPPRRKSGGSPPPQTNALVQTTQSASHSRPADSLDHSARRSSPPEVVAPKARSKPSRQAELDPPEHPSNPAKSQPPPDADQFDKSSPPQEKLVLEKQALQSGTHQGALPEANGGSLAGSSPEEDKQSPAAEGEQIGQAVADYQLIRRLGRGGMAEVWLAEHQSLQRQVALKILRTELATDETYIQRFRIEAQAAAQLVHPNIVQIYDIGCAEGIHYIAQEYVPGQNLREFLVRHGPPELPLAVSMMCQVAAALQKAAEAGIVHRDIKPENILIARTGEVKVADFGLARLTGDGQTLNLTQVGMTMGTPLYMSPEQVEGRVLDARSDLYSFGITCYHMLAGSPPFRGETALSVAVQHLKTRPEPLESLRPDLPPALCRMVHKLLAKDPGGRYVSARELVQDLRALQSASGDSGEFEAMLPSSGFIPGLTPATERLAMAMRTQTLQSQPQRRTRVIWATVLVAALLVGISASLLTRPRPLLADANQATVPRQSTAFRQYLWAMKVNTEPAWHSISKYFPEDERYRWLSQKQLARLHVREGDYDQAEKIFRALLKLPDSQAELRAFALAGQALVHHERGNEREFQMAITLLNGKKLRDKVDPDLQELLSTIEQSE